MEDFIVHDNVLDKNILWFLQIRFQLAKIAPEKSGLKQEKLKI
jgi:hypothetical protein